MCWSLATAAKPTADFKKAGESREFAGQTTVAVTTNVYGGIEPA